MIEFQKSKSFLLFIVLLSLIIFFSNPENFQRLEDDAFLIDLKDFKSNNFPSVNSDNCVICINGDQDLISYGFPGSGNESDPYRIENLSISTIKDYGIYLENTTKNVVIQHCRIYAHYRAIEIYNTTENTIIIINNTLTSDNYFGIFISKSPYIKIINNEISDCEQAIEFNDSPFTHVVNNTLFDNICSIRVEYRSPYSKILGNNISNNYEVIWLANSGGFFLIKDNLIINNNFGILLAGVPGPYYPDSCLVIHNLIEGIKWYGLRVESNYNSIFRNTFINNNPEGTCQANDVGLHNVWYDVTSHEGNYWSNWWGLGPYYIDGLAKSKDLYPSELPHHTTNTPIPKIFLGRVILRLFVGLGYAASIMVSFLIVNKFKKRVRE